MTVIEKIDQLEKALDVNDRKFAKDFHIPFLLLKKWRSGKVRPKANELAYLCEQFGLSLTDFMDDNSSISRDQKYANEHDCIARISSEKPVSIIYEDYPREDNGRYEETD